MGREFGTTFSYDVPRILAFYQDVLDDDGNSLGWKTVAWGLRRKDGWTVTFGVDDPPSIRLWSSTEDAMLTLDAYIDAPEPRARLDQLLPPSAAATRGKGTPSPVERELEADAS